MSARECLNHTWMKKTITRPTPTIVSTTAFTTMNPISVIRAESSPSIISVTPSTKVDENLTSAEVASVETDATPTAVTGRPPLHPRSSLKSLSSSNDFSATSVTPVLAVATLPATTPFLNKESRMGSRQNLSRLRSMSKSREVLSERIQMSNLKKTLSKSRERLYDARLGLSTSKDDLLNCQSLSQSVEALTALSQLHQNGALYKSCNNIYIPMLKPHVRVATAQGRMYQSMASIDKIPANELANKMGYFESRFSTDEYCNDNITRHNTNLNTVVRDSPSDDNMRLCNADDSRLVGLRGNTCRGGRTAEGSDRVCARHTHKQPEAQSTQKINKMSRSDRMKKDAQRRRKERKEREQRDKERHRKYSLGDHEMNRKSEKSSEGPISPTTRRGSVCHVEQRLQERHERLLEKQERESRKLGITVNKRLGSIESDRSPTSDRSPKIVNTKQIRLTIPEKRPRSISPSVTVIKKNDFPHDSDVSQASSMESVVGSLENVQTLSKSRMSSCSSIQSENTDMEITINIMDEFDAEPARPQGTSSNETHKDQDEAYISLEEGTKEVTLLENKSDDGESVKSDRTLTGSVADDIATDTIDELHVHKRTTEITHNKITEIDDKCDELLVESTQCSQKTCDAVKCSFKIDEPKLLTVPEEPECKYMRSVSTTSDLGSTVSEESEETSDQFFSVDIEAKISDYKSRARSYSFQHKSDQFLVVPKGRNRSHSVNQGVNDKSRPWGDVCSGSIAKALKNFTMQEDKTSSEE